MITIAICDDDLDAISILQNHIREIITYSQFNDLTYTYIIASSSKELLEKAKNSAIDILFLDIQLPGESGLQIAKKFQESYPNTAIIFISNFESYVFYSMRFRPFRFLRKSKIKDELPEALLSVLKHVNHPTTTLLLKSSNNFEPLQIQKIVYIEKEKKSNYVLIHLSNRIIKERANLADIEQILSKRGFCKINPSTIINIKHVVKSESLSVELSNHIVLPVSNKYRPTFINQLINYFRQEEDYE